MTLVSPAQSPAGIAPVVSVHIVRRPWTGGLLYDLATRSTRLNPDGSLAYAHPWDEMAGIALGTKRGSCLASPTTGNDLHLITNLTQANLDAQIRDTVNAATPLDSLIANGRIVIVSIPWEVDLVLGRLTIPVNYRNTSDPTELRRIYAGQHG